MWRDKVVLGRTGLSVSRLGIASSFGVQARDVERAFERGINYLYWGTARTAPFGEALRNLGAKRREAMVTVIQSYTRVGALMRPSLERALRATKLEYTDVLLLGWWNQPPPRRILDAAIALRESGKARHIVISCHDRHTFARYAADPTYGAIMVRYNAAHPGAEREVFPYLGERPPGVVAYTATRWGALLDPLMVPEGERAPRASDCYRFALSHRAVNVVLFGPRDGADVDEALTTLDRGPMSEDELAWMKRVGAGVREKAANARRFAPVRLLDRIAGGSTE
ncbi:MAG: aldo/keto reductase [Deltaproteobacteria bacterium]|nr:aldo/keto reductase [Deltaproteobacteria bacterium]